MTEFNPTFNGGGLNKPQSKPEDKSNSGKSKVEEKEIKEPNDSVETPTENPVETPAETPAEEFFEEDLNEEYTDNRTIIVSLVSNYSNYRRVNMASLGPVKATIGSSVRSTRTLMGHKGEIEAYFPSLLGISATHNDFVSRVKSYLSNIQFTITGGDAKLDTSFVYYHKSDYLVIKEKEDKILAAYNRIPKNNLDELYKGAVKRDKELDILESTKYKYGYPVNLEEYILYRHCILYSEVAKDPIFINGNQNLRFYIKDLAREEARKKKLVEERKIALRNIVELDSSPSRFQAVYVAVCKASNQNIAAALNKDKIRQTTELMDYANLNPDKFNKFVNDKNVVLKAFIETLIVRGELIRSTYNQQITTADGGFIGANLNEAVAYFNNPNNNAVKVMYENKLKLI